MVISVTCDPSMSHRDGSLHSLQPLLNDVLTFLAQIFSIRDSEAVLEHVLHFFQHQAGHFRIEEIELPKP